MKTLRTIFFACFFTFAATVSAITPREVSDMAMEGYRIFVRDSLPDDREKGYAMMLDAAWEGDAKAANNIGWLMQQGDFVEKDLPGALRWYERAADQGLPAAALNYVSMIFHHPESLQGKPIDIDRLANAAKIAGNALTMGRGLHYDYRQGEELLMRAALLGNEQAALTIAQQLEMYPDSFSYLPLMEIVKECDSILPPDLRHLHAETSQDSFIDQILTPSFWYAKISHPAN